MAGLVELGVIVVAQLLWISVCIVVSGLCFGFTDEALNGGLIFGCASLLVLTIRAIRRL